MRAAPRVVFIFAAAVSVAAVAATAPAQTPTLPLTLEEATRRTLERNTTLAVERENVEQAGFAILRARGAYDILWNADVGWQRSTDPVNSAFSGSAGGGLAPEVETVSASTSFSQLLPTGGTVSLFGSGNRSSTDSIFTILSPAYSTDLGVAVRQPLLRNLSMDPAREALRVAAADRSASEARLTRVVADTIREVDASYWSLVAARRDVTSITSAVALADKQLSEPKSRVEAGPLGETEIAQPTAERERRKGDLALARQRAGEAENNLKRLVLGNPRDPSWPAEIVPTDDPELATSSPDVEKAVETAFARRPEIAEAKARWARFEVQVEARKSDLKPRLDLVAAYERRGLAGRRNPVAIGFSDEPVVVPPALEGTWGRSYGTIADNEFPDASVGVSFSLPIGNRAARANLAIAKSALSQATLTVSGEEQQVQAEVRVLTRQNDLTNARVTETSALTDYRKAATEFARATGVLLEERRIEVEVENK